MKAQRDNNEVRDNKSTSIIAVQQLLSQVPIMYIT